MTEQMEVVSRPIRRRMRIRDPHIKALAKFMGSLDAANEQTRYASIQYLADRYLGIKNIRRGW